MLDNTLIEKALSLTGKTIKDVEQEVPMPYEDYTMDEFYIEKFCYYLLSPEFLEKYTDLGITYIIKPKLDYSNNRFLFNSSRFGQAIYEYQLGNEESLTNLLSKI